MPCYDYAELKQKIDTFGLARFSREAKISKKRLDALLCGTREFTFDEIIRAAKVLSLSGDDISAHFFAEKVQKL